MSDIEEQRGVLGNSGAATDNDEENEYLEWLRKMQG